MLNKFETSNYFIILVQILIAKINKQSIANIQVRNYNIIIYYLFTKHQYYYLFTKNQYQKQLMSYLTNESQIKYSKKEYEKQDQIDKNKWNNNLKFQKQRQEQQKLQQSLQKKQLFVQGQKENDLRKEKSNQIIKECQQNNELKHIQKKQSLRENQQIQVQRYLNNAIQQNHHHMITSINKKQLVQIPQKKEHNKTYIKNQHDQVENIINQSKEHQKQNQEQLFESIYQDQCIQRKPVKNTYQKQVQQIIFEQQQNKQLQQDKQSEKNSFESQIILNQTNKQGLQEKSQQTIIQFDFQNKKINSYSYQKSKKKQVDQIVEEKSKKIQLIQKIKDSKSIHPIEQKKMNIKQVDSNAFYVSNSQNLYPSLSLHSQKAQNNSCDSLATKIKIHSYRVQQFLKMETQIYQIVVYGKNQNYQIERRYSDFLFLFQSIMTNHLGYILYPFPLKNINSFLKIKLSIGQQNQKYQLIQKRIKQLEEFVNYLIFHVDLRNSQQLGIFLVEDNQLYQKGKSRIQKYVEQYNQLQNLTNANIQNFISGGFSFVKSWIGKQSSEPQNISLSSRKMSQQDLQSNYKLEIINNQIENYKKVFEFANNLLLTQKKLSDFHDIETDFDELLKLSTKIASGKQYCRYFHDWLENQMIDQTNFVLRSLYQIQTQLTKRSQLAQLAFLAQKSNETTKKSKLKRRIQRFDANFENGFKDFIKNCNKQYEQKKKTFKKTWEQHRKKMMKIWI